MKEIRKGVNNLKHYTLECFWCKREVVQRYDVYNRQMSKYGHSCCENCFGREPSFREARSRVMKENNPFKGKKHTEETKKILSDGRMGAPAWNKGLSASTSESVKKYADAVRVTKSKQDLTGENNPNWRGGASFIGYSHHPKDWMIFRKNIIRRDCQTCYKCSNKFLVRELRVHHLKSRTVYPDMEYDDRNCATLCEGCHRSFHAKYGIKNFTPTDFKEFINEGRAVEGYFKFD